MFTLPCFTEPLWACLYGGEIFDKHAYSATITRESVLSPVTYTRMCCLKLQSWTWCRVVSHLYPLLFSVCVCENVSFEIKQPSVLLITRVGTRRLKLNSWTWCRVISYSHMTLSSTWKTYRLKCWRGISHVTSEYTRRASHSDFIRGFTAVLFTSQAVSIVLKCVCVLITMSRYFTIQSEIIRRYRRFNVGATNFVPPPKEQACVFVQYDVLFEEINNHLLPWIVTFLYVRGDLVLV
jgi:hypothetical protein